MDYFLGKYKLLKLSEGIEKLDNLVADEETEMLSKIYVPFKRVRCFALAGMALAYRPKDLGV